MDGLARKPTAVLTGIARDLFAPERLNRLRAIADTQPFDLDALVDFDDSVPGPSMRRLEIAVRARLSWSSRGHEWLSIDDRDVFRPLQYCAMAFEGQDLEWRMRDVVENAGLHLEGLTKRLGGYRRRPLGAAVQHLGEKLDPVRCQMARYADLHNSAKHEFEHELGTHLFSISDAVFAYMNSRMLGLFLYPRAAVKSNWWFGGNPQPPS